MIRVAVNPVTGTHHPQQSGHRSLFSRVKRKVASAWHSSHVGHRSQYSVERLLAFRDYHHNTSLSHAIAVCVLTPIPALLAALAIDCIPLASPSDGWQVNSALWMRMFCSIFVISIGLVLQTQEVIVARTISTTAGVTIAAGAATAYVLGSISLAAAWTFPIPFGYVLMVGPYIAIFWVFTLLVIGLRRLASSPLLQHQIKFQMLDVTAQGLVAVAYPVFSAIFDHLSGHQQAAFIFVMPVIKFFTKQVVAKTNEHLHEYVGPLVIFSVDVFNVYYVAICMQAAASTLTALLFIASDSFHVIVALHYIFQSTNITQGSSQSPEATQSANYLRDLPLVVREVYRDVKKSPFLPIRVRAPFSLHLSNESRALMKKLEVKEQLFFSSVAGKSNKATGIQAAGVHDDKDRTGKAQQARVLFAISASKQHQIAPATTPQMLSEEPNLECVASRKNSALVQLALMNLHTRFVSTTLQNASTQKSSDEAAFDALQALFHSEYVLMAEYMEFMLPMLYAVYLGILFRLPVAAYYPHTASLTPERLATKLASISLFAAVEFIAFGLMVVLLRRKFGFSPVYQLAFVLETQFRTVQGHLFVWNLYILHLTLAHYGAFGV